MNKGIYSSLLAGKLAVGLPYAYAMDDENVRPQLTLDEIGEPANIVTSPADDGSVGLIHVNLAAKERINFLIKGIQNDRAVQVFLAFSKSAGRSDQWNTFADGQGQLELEEESLQLLAGLTIQPATDLGLSSSTTFGESIRTHESVLVPVSLSDLSEIGSEGETLFFQAVVLPFDEDTGELNWDLAQASEVDKFMINKGNLDIDPGQDPDLEPDPEPDPDPFGKSN